MLHFIQNFTYYLLHEVIDVKWFEMSKSMEKATTSII